MRRNIVVIMKSVTSIWYDSLVATRLNSGRAWAEEAFACLQVSPKLAEIDLSLLKWHNSVYAAVRRYSRIVYRCR